MTEKLLYHFDFLFGKAKCYKNLLPVLQKLVWLQTFLWQFTNFRPGTFQDTLGDFEVPVLILPDVIEKFSIVMPMILRGKLGYRNLDIEIIAFEIIFCTLNQIY